MVLEEQKNKKAKTSIKSVHKEKINLRKRNKENKKRKESKKEKQNESQKKKRERKKK